MKNTSVFVIILFLVLTGCFSESELDGDKLLVFPEADRQISGTQVLDRLVLIGDFGICSDSEMMIVLSDAEPVIRVFDRNYDEVASFGRKGRGPGEFALVPYIQEVHENPCEFSYFDSITRSLYSVNIAESVDRGETIRNVIFSQSSTPGSAWNTYEIDEGVYFGMYDDTFIREFDGGRGIYLLSNESGETSSYSLYNLAFQEGVTNLPDPNAPVNINARAWDFSREYSLAVTALVYAPVIEIIRITEFHTIEVTTLIYEEIPRSFTFSDYEQGQTDVFASLISASKNNFIVLLENEDSQKLVFIDYDLNVKQILETDINYGLSRIRYDEQYNRIYGLSYEEDAIFRFDL